MQAVRIKIEHGVSLLQSYLSSVNVRGDTKASLLLGLCAGMVVVGVMAAYPGKPIDYSGAGECLWWPTVFKNPVFACCKAKKKVFWRLGFCRSFSVALERTQQQRLVPEFRYFDISAQIWLLFMTTRNSKLGTTRTAIVLMLAICPISGTYVALPIVRAERKEPARRSPLAILCLAAGTNLPLEMRGGEEAVDAARGKKDDGDKPGAAGTQRQAGGIRQIQGIVDDLSDLRRRKGSRRTPPAQEKCLVEGSAAPHAGSVCNGKTVSAGDGGEREAGSKMAVRKKSPVPRSKLVLAVASTVISYPACRGG